MLSKKRNSRQAPSRTAKYKYYVLGVSIVLFILSSLLSQPRWIFSIATRLFPGALYARVPQNNEKIVALTIDDGPSTSTQAILNVLEQHDVKATFFNISGNLPGHEHVVQQAIAANHEMGNHLTADTASIQLSPKQFESALLSAEAQLLALHPEQPTLKWLRPGMGFYNNTMIRTAKRHGYHTVLGSRFPYDTHIPSSQFSNTFILRTLQTGDIIVLHDGEEDNRGDRTVKTLQTVLPALKSRGYTITTLSQLAAVSTQ